MSDLRNKKFYFESTEVKVFSVTFINVGTNNITLINTDKVKKEDNIYYFYIQENLICIIPEESIEEGSLSYG